MMAVIGLIAGMIVLAAVLMSVLERTREFGVLMSIGLRPRRLAAMVLLEGLALGIVGSLIGLVLGAIPSYLLVTHGLDMTAMMGGDSYEAGGVAVSAVIKGEWHPTRTLAYAGAAVFFTVLAAIYPAWWLTRLTPLDAMRHH